MLTVDQLWELLDRLTPAPLPVEHICLSGAFGRVLREPAIADADQPAFDRSAFDGYLLSLGQPTGPVTVLGIIAPGSPAPASPPAINEAWRIYTGAAIPAGDVGIVMQEDARTLPDGRVQINVAPQSGLIRRRGSQCRVGDMLLPAGRRLSAAHLALLAGSGITQPAVTRRVRMAHLATGAELVSPDTTPPPGQIRDTNSTLIAALVAESGAELVWQQRVSDDREQTLRALHEALAAEPDLLLIGGGSSVGDHDHTASLLREIGFELHAEKVASRPGKPFITASRGPLLACGLPGNPLAHGVCFHLFVRRLIDRLHGLTPAALLVAPLADGAKLKSDARETWWPAVWDHRQLSPLPWRDSSDLTVLASANVLLRLPAGAAPSAEVQFLPLP